MTDEAIAAALYAALLEGAKQTRAYVEAEAELNCVTIDGHINLLVAAAELSKLIHEWRRPVTQQ